MGDRDLTFGRDDFDIENLLSDIKNQKDSLKNSIVIADNLFQNYFNYFINSNLDTPIDYNDLVDSTHVWGVNSEDDADIDFFTSFIRDGKYDLLSLMFIGFDGNDNESGISLNHINSLYEFFILNLGKNLSKYVYALCDTRYNEYSNALIDLGVFTQSELADNKTIGFFRLYNKIGTEFVSIVDYMKLDEDAQYETLKRMFITIIERVYSPEVFDLENFVKSINYMSSRATYTNEVEMLVMSGHIYSIFVDEEKLVTFVNKVIANNLLALFDEFMKFNASKNLIL